MLTIGEAQEKILQHIQSFGTTQVPLEEALHQVLAADVLSDRDYPPFHRSAMDGYAIRSADINEKKLRSLTLIGYVHAGQVAGSAPFDSGQCIKIMTGAPVPAGADAVVRIEDTVSEGSQIRFKVETVRPGQNIARQGEDARQGDLLLKAPRFIDPTVMGVLAVTGQTMVKVYRPPRVAIFSTGNEVFPVDSPLETHQIRDSNSHVLGSFFRRYPVRLSLHPPVADDKELLRQAIAPLLDNNIIVLSGGVSMGDADYVPEVLQSLGVKELFHRVQIKPGNPLWLGISPSGGVVFGLPGNPVSVQVAFKVFIEPYLRSCWGLPLFPSFYFPFEGHRMRKTRFDEYFPCHLRHSDNRIPFIQAAVYHGSGDIAAVAQSDGLALHPSFQESIHSGMLLSFIPW